MALGAFSRTSTSISAVAGVSASDCAAAGSSEGFAFPFLFAGDFAGVVFDFSCCFLLGVFFSFCFFSLAGCCLSAALVCFLGVAMAFCFFCTGSVSTSASEPEAPSVSS